MKLRVSLKYFRGYRLSTKIFYLKFFYSKINLNKNFPDYGTFKCFLPSENSMTDRECMGEVMTQVWLKSIKK